MTYDIDRVGVLIATYRRPEGLVALLESIKDARHVVLHDVIVVDNDRQDSDVVRAITESRGAAYYHEPKPGIVAARNRALEEVSTKKLDAYVFVDDDEIVSHGWLDKLVDAANLYRAEVVAGPVLPRYAENLPWWVTKLGFFDRYEAETGSDIRWPATNNVLVRRQAVEGLSTPRFSEEFSSTGGSDTEFFSRIRSDGASFRWCAEAYVEESIAADRGNFSWLWRRGIRLGNVSARMIEKRSGSRISAPAIAVCRIAAALPLAVYQTARGRLHRVGSNLMHIPKGVGMLRAVRGSYVHEYAREDQGDPNGSVDVFTPPPA